jgi:hypothetical protein
MRDQLNLKAIELEKNLKKCEGVSDAGIKILKFKKFPNTKEPLDVINGQALTASLEAQTEDLLGDCRSCKAHSSAR